jgi:uncharacterized membrane protein YdjX (TVP38/TMEM64 family)
VDVVSWKPIKFSRKALIVIGLLLLVLAVYYLYSGAGLEWNEEQLVLRIRSFGILAPLASIGIMILHSFLPFPGELIAMANGMVFGPIWGTVYTWTGAMLGAWISFWLTRKWGQPLVNRMFPSRRIEQMSVWKKVDSPWSLIVLRLIPLISFNLLNYVLGLTKVSVWRFTWTTAIGILPTVILSVVFGNSLANSNMILTVVSGVILVIFILAVWVNKRVNRRG